MNLMSKKSPASATPDATFIALAHAALLEITTLDTFRDAPVVTRGEDTVDVAYPSTQQGYPGWKWTVSLAHAEGMEPTVLELELLPGEGSLVAPDWVPWADRLEEYLLHEKELKEQEAAADSDDDDDDDDDSIELDDDRDGVDIDQLDLELDPSPLEVPDEADDVFDHVELDEPGSS